MSKFKVGDKVRRTAASTYLTVGEVYTVDVVSPLSGNIQVGTGRLFSYDLFELVPDNECIREEITDAVAVLRKYDTYLSSTGTIYKVSGYGSACLENYLDKHYPLKTPQQLEIESIRKEQEKLAQRLKELEGAV